MTSQAHCRRIGIILNGVTGRMGTNQHLMRSMVPIIKQGGVRVSPTETLMPDPVLVGRNPIALQRLAAESGIDNWSTDPDAVLSDPRYTVYFDAQTTNRRLDAVRKAIAAGKHVYCEKPTATTVDDAYALYAEAQAAGVKHGVVQDKLWLASFRKLKTLVDKGFFGRILEVRGEFGYWVFEGDVVTPQRPSWNYRAEDGGGMMLDMLCHWRYLIDNLFSPIRSLSCLGATHIKERRDETGRPYKCTADDAAYATFELAGGIVCQFNSSWCTRVRRDDLLTVQVDGTLGSALAGLRDVWLQPYGATPRPTWNPDVPQPIDFHDGWQIMPEQEPCENAFKLQWEKFLRHVALDEPFRWDLLEGAKGVQLAQLGMQSWRERRWVDLPELRGIDAVK